MQIGDSIFFLVLFIVVLYLFITSLIQISKIKTRNSRIRIAQKEYSDAQYKESKLRFSLIKTIENLYGTDKAQKVDIGTIWIGMPETLLLIARGKANDIKQTIYHDNVKEKWLYGAYETRLRTIKHKLEITVENNVVVGWKDLV